MSKSGKILIISTASVALVLGGLGFAYLKVLPFAVSNPKVIQFVEKKFNKYTDADLEIKNPVLKTHLTPNIEFTVENVSVNKENEPLLDLNNFKTDLSFKKIFSKTLIIKKLVAESVFADINGLQSLFPRQEQKKEEKKKSDWKIDTFDALLGVKQCEIKYLFNNDILVHLKGEKIGVNNANKIKRNVYFQLLADITRKDKHATLKLNDNRSVFFAEKHFHVQNCPLSINNSNIFIDLIADKKQNYDINLFSKNFNLNDILDFLNTQIIENNVQDSLVYFSDIKGNIDFKLNIKNNDLNGNFKVNKVKFKVKDVDNLPVTITKGNIDLTPEEVKLTGFEGFYDNNTKNKIDFAGTVKDYLNSIDTDIVGNAIARNDFFKTHLTKMTGTPIEIKGEAPTRIIVKSKNNIMDFVWYFMLKPGQNIKVANDYLPFENTLRLMKSDIHLENNILDIKSIDYHMIPEDKLPDMNAPRKERPKGPKPKPIFTLNGKLDIAHNNNIKNLGFEIPQPLPSEFLNAVLKQQLFKRGKISGKLYMDNNGAFPVLNGSMSMDKVLIPSQMTFIKEAVLDAKNNLIHLNATGGYRHAKFSFNGDILNELRFPIIVKDVNLSLENIDILKMLELFNNQDTGDSVIVTDTGNVNVENSNEEFDIRNLIIEKARFHLDNGTYKDIKFGNLDADLTLNKDGVIDIKSNRFDFAEGISSLKAMFDLVNKKYNVKLGVVNTNSDILANALLDLKREITGKGSGFLDLTTDDSLKLSGVIKFKVSDGTIEKMGLVEYVMKCASLLRNTLTMISPGIIADIINVPEGHFDKITGTIILKNNVATGIKIKTFSPQLSTYITGRYNIDNGDTSLRIYTKFSNTKKGFAGFLRKISLNTLASRIPFNSRNDVNYYAVELSELPDIDANEKDCQIYLTKVEGDVANNNYISSLKKLK